MVSFGAKNLTFPGYAVVSHAPSPSATALGLVCFRRRIEKRVGCCGCLGTYPFWTRGFAGWGGFWFLILSLQGRFGGWATLAESYRLEGDFTGPRWRFQSALLRRWTIYGNCLTIGANPRGLYLACPLCRPAHPPLFIPWQDISIADRPFQLFRYKEFRFRREPEIPVLIRPRLAKKIGSAAAASWPAGQQLTPASFAR